LEQFSALRERLDERDEWQEYYAALIAWAVLMPHRKDDSSQTFSPDTFRLRWKLRRQHMPQSEPQKPRYKEPGERPPLTGPTVDPALLAPPRKANSWPMPVN